MPTGPKGEKRPADVIGNAVKVMRIATGEEAESPSKPVDTVARSKGGTARARNLTESQKKEIAKKGAQARWEKDRLARAKKEQA